MPKKGLYLIYAAKVNAARLTKPVYKKNNVPSTSISWVSRLRRTLVLLLH